MSTSFKGITTYTCAGCNRIKPYCDRVENNLCDRCWAIQRIPLCIRWFYYIFPFFIGEHICDKCDGYKYKYVYKITINGKGFRKMDSVIKSILIITVAFLFIFGSAILAVYGAMYLFN